MKSIATLLMLAIFSLSAATAVSAPKERPATAKEQKRSKKQDGITAAFELLKSHQFAILRYSLSGRETFHSDDMIVYVDKTNSKFTKLLFEEFDE